MINCKQFKRDLSFSSLHLDLVPVGEDICAVLYGGEKPHIGCTVLAVPRPSLKGDGSMSCTSSVINLTGHKDEQICRYAAEELCRKHQVSVTCTGGFHVDGITKEQLSELMRALDDILCQGDGSLSPFKSRTSVTTALLPSSPVSP